MVPRADTFPLAPLVVNLSYDHRLAFFVSGLD